MVVWHLYDFTIFLFSKQQKRVKLTNPSCAFLLLPFKYNKHTGEIAKKTKRAVIGD